MRRPGVTIKIGPEGDREVAVIIVRETRPDEAAQAQPRDVRCDRCAVGREGDLRQLVFRGKTRYAERTVCDECAEELLELFLDTPVAAHPPAPVVRVFRARVKTGRQDAFWERLRTRSIPDLVQASGLLAYFPGEPLSESDEFVMVTVWRSFEALLALIVCGGALPAGLEPRPDRRDVGGALRRSSPRTRDALDRRRRRCLGHVRPRERRHAA